MKKFSHRRSPQRLFRVLNARHRQSVRATTLMTAIALATASPGPSQNIDLASFDSGATADGFAILGAGIGDESGVSVSGAGDVNGDGFADLIIGANLADGPSDGRPLAGDSYVLFGKSTGFANIDLASLDYSASADGFAILGAAIGHLSGDSTSSVGDINGDGFADIIVGATGADGPLDARDDAGACYVILGKASGFTNIDLASFNAGATANGFAILGAYSTDRAGVSVSGAGDFNGDGFSDILLGAHFAKGPLDERTNAGDSYIIFGKSTAFTNIDLASFDDGATSAGFAIHGAFTSDVSGTSVSGAGDVNGDGYSDLIIGASAADGPSDDRSAAGDSYVIFGKASGFTNIDLASFDDTATTEGFAVWGANSSDYTGGSVSGAGDVNGDGFSDILIGALGADGPSDERDRAGDSYIIFGKPSGFSNIDLASLNDSATSAGFSILGAASSDFSGGSTSGGGDVNGDGFSDFLIGAVGAAGPSDGRDGAGDSYVIFGKPSEFANIDLANLDALTTNGFTIFGAADEDMSGWALSGAGDFNGDGFSDILIGAVDADGPMNQRATAGDSYLIFGRESVAAPGSDNIPSSATYRTWAPGGAVTPQQGIGIVGDGSNFDVPTSRVSIGFVGPENSGGPRSNGASLQEVTLYRHSDLVQNFTTLPESSIADVSWHIKTNRENYTSTTLQFLWTGSETAGLNCDALALYRSASLEGPWQRILQTTNEPTRRRITAEISPLAQEGEYIILVGEWSDRSSFALELVEVLVGNQPAAPYHDFDRDAKISITDLVALLQENTTTPKSDD